MNAISERAAERAVSPIIEIRDQISRMDHEFKAALPSHIPVERFKRVVMTAIQNNPELAQVTRKSLFNSAMKAAQDGLLPDGREGAMVVRFGRNGKEASWQPMIAGIRKKVRNSGEIADWHCHVVHAKDEWDYALGDNPYIHHKPYGGEGDPGPTIAVYSIADLKTGEKSREVMTVWEVNQIRDETDAYKAYKAGKIKSTPWSTHYDEMAKKTVARRHSKVLPMSTDLDDLIRRDDELYDHGSASDAEVKPRPKTSMESRLDSIAGGVGAQQQIDHDPTTGEILDEGDNAGGEDNAGFAEPISDDARGDGMAINSGNKEDASDAEVISETKPAEGAKAAAASKTEVMTVEQYENRVNAIVERATDAEELAKWWNGAKEKALRASNNIPVDDVNRIKDNVTKKVEALKAGKA